MWYELIYRKQDEFGRHLGKSFWQPLEMSISYELNSTTDNVTYAENSTTDTEETEEDGTSGETGTENSEETLEEPEEWESDNTKYFDGSRIGPKGV